MRQHGKILMRVLKGLAPALALALVLATAAVTHAAPQYDLSCITCHQLPPRDSGTADKDPFTGAIPGNHQTHAGAAIATCTTCHGNGVQVYTTTHVNGQIELVPAVTYSRVVSGFLNQTSVPPSPLGSCSTAVCHSNGKGNVAATPAWGSAPFAAPADCGQCHGVAPATGSHPVTGSKHAAYLGTGTGSCASCHANHPGEAKPFAHATSAVNERAIDVRFAQGGSFSANSCSNVYCHSNGKGSFASPTWGGSLDCAGCHGTAATTGAGELSGKHAKHVNNAAFLGTSYGCVECHAATVSDNSTIADTAVHVNGAVNVTGARTGSVVSGSCATSYCHSDGKGSQKSVTWNQTEALDCKGCHGSDAAPAFASVAGEPNYANAGADQPKANSHQNHVTSAANCQNCHGTTTADGISLMAGAPHTNGTRNVVAGNGKSFTYAGTTCSNVSCHGGNGIISGVAPAKWGASLGCAGCHGDAATLASNAHAKHVNAKGYACDTCHAATVSGSSTIINSANHGDASVEVQGGFTYTLSPNKTCATSCHGSATPSWTDTASGACGTCHAALSTTGGVIATNAHGAHFTAAYGPALAANSTTSCATCHIYTGDTAATHVNNAVNLAAGYNKIGTCTGCHSQSVNWTAGRISCESCHSTAAGALSVVNGVTAPDKTLAASAGHGKTGINQSCTACHDNGSAHINGVVGDQKRLLPALTGAANTECNYCHRDSGKVGANALNMQVHIGLGNQCAACHDPHGSLNANMIRSQVNGQTVSFSGTDFVNAQGTGICQVCHTSTLYYRAGVAEPAGNHPTTGCLTCHPHNSTSGTAFEPNRSCDSCHGYPPAPRRTTTAVTFGVQGSWSTARFEDYSGGGGAHVVAAHLPKGAKASDGWANCLPCHNNGEASHTKLIPIRSHVDNVTVKVNSKLRFSGRFQATYTSAKFVNGGANQSGSCFNVSCHLSKTPKWSIER